LIIHNSTERGAEIKMSQEINFSKRTSGDIPVPAVVILRARNLCIRVSGVAQILGFGTTEITHNIKHRYYRRFPDGCRKSILFTIILTEERVVFIEDI
jgi:hypothetical protein